MTNSRQTDEADSYQIGGEHYKAMPIEPWQLLEAVLTPDEFIGFLKGSMMKYVLRAGHKPGADDDADKARHYLQKLQEFQGYR